MLTKDRSSLRFKSTRPSDAGSSSDDSATAPKSRPSKENNKNHLKKAVKAGKLAIKSVVVNVKRAPRNHFASSKSTVDVKLQKADTSRPVHDTRPHDVLSGRGGRINATKGNTLFRQLVAEYKPGYMQSTNQEKQALADHVTRIVTEEWNPPGRFLIEVDAGSNVWYEMTEKAVFAKVTQALRENKDRVLTEMGNQVPSQPSRAPLSKPKTTSSTTVVAEKPLSFHDARAKAMDELSRETEACEALLSLGWGYMRRCHAQRSPWKLAAE